MKTYDPHDSPYSRTTDPKLAHDQLVAKIQYFQCLIDDWEKQINLAEKEDIEVGKSNPDYEIQHEDWWRGQRHVRDELAMEYAEVFGDITYDGRI